ncbi:MAG: hypothetical protein JF615_03960 [Asticcacaulis sp.]|nr:hypothetical protein [Asticcacaulis sp.]
MRSIAGLAAALFIVPFAALAAPADYELVPAAHRGQVVAAGDTKTYTADNGWYTVSFGPGDSTDTADGLRYFTFGKATPGHYVDMAVAMNGLVEGEQALVLDAVEGGMIGMINGGYVPSLLQGKPVTERKILTLGDGNGRKPMQLMLWVSDDGQAVTVVAGTMLPKGNLMILIDADNAADAETALREHFRIAEGVLE